MLDETKVIENYLKQNDWRVKENSSVPWTLGGLILHQAGSMTANYWLNNLYSEDLANAHKNADLHLHDLSLLSGYCAGWGLKDLVERGLSGVKGKLVAAPAKHLSTIVQQIVNFLGIMQNEWSGAQALNGLDTYLAPFIKKDSLGEKEICQCLQNLLFGLNVPSRWGGQAPFSNVSLDWTIPEDLKNEAARVGGEDMNFTYGDCQEEMDLFNRCLFKIYLAGDAEGNGFEYPIPTISITEEFDWNNPNVKPLFEITAKYGTPYFSNYLNTDMSPSDVRSMCSIHPDSLIQVELEEDIVECDGKFYTIENMEKIMDQNTKNTSKGNVIFHKKGDRIKLPISYNFKYKVRTSHGYEKPQFRQDNYYDENLVVVEFSNGTTIKMTREHRHDIITTNGQTEPVLSVDLKVGMKSLTVDGQQVEIVSLKEEPYKGICCDFTMPNDVFYANDIQTRNCRLRLDLRELSKKGGGLFGAYDSTGSIGVVTLNLPKVGYLARKDLKALNIHREDITLENCIEIVKKRLDYLLELSFEALETKRKVVSKYLEEGLYPYTKAYLGTFNNHFSTIGLVGMNELLLNLLSVDISSEVGQQVSFEILGFMREKLSDFQERSGNLYNLEETPAESTTYRLAKHDLEQFPDIIHQGPATAPYYTNSTHLAVDKTSDLWMSLDHQGKMQDYYTGGTAFHIFMGDGIEDWETARDLIRKACETSTVPYISLTPSFSICPYHGYLKGTYNRCPKCQEEQVEEYKKELARIEEKERLEQNK